MSRNKSAGKKDRGMRLDRRSFLVLGGTGAAAASVNLIPGAPRAIDKLADQAVHRHLPESFLESVCGDCPAACKLLLRRVGDEIVGVRPLDEPPCARAYTIPQQLVHPDRVGQPMALEGSRGSGRWRPVAANELTGTLGKALGGHRRRVAVLLADDGELSSYYLGSLAHAMGAVVGRSRFVIEDGPVDAMKDMTGWPAWDADLTHASGVLCLGYDALQRLDPPVRMHEAYRHLRCGEKPLPIISVGPRLDLTAMKADAWHACAVGTEPLVALWLCRELIEQKGYDPSVESLQGFDVLAKSLGEFDREAVSRRTGLAPAVAERLARDLGRHRWLCLGPRRRLEDQRPIVMLNALLGNLGREGGWLPQARIEGPEPWVNVGDGEAIPDAVSRGDVESVVIYGANPVFSSAQPDRWRSALTKAKQVVVFAECFNETAEMADLVVPLAHAAERTWRSLRVMPDGLTVEVTPPCARRGEAVPDPFDLFIALSKDLGESDGALVPESAEAYVASFEHGVPPTPTVTLGELRWNEPPWESGALHLLFETPTTLRRMSGGHLPYLITSVSPHLRRWWETTLEINPETARRLSLEDNQIVRITSAVGRIEARVQLFDGIRPDAVCALLGLGHNKGAFAGRVGGNPAELVPVRGDGPVWDFTKVDLEVS